MGEVSFVIGDVEKDRRGKKTYNPNMWLNVVPTDDSPSDGKLQVAVMFEDALAPKHDNYRTCEQVRTLRAGPHVSGDPRAAIKTARTPVFLHVYDVGHSSCISTFNRASELAVGGVFHGAIQIFGKEYSFGGSKANQSGIFACNPTRCPMHTYRESVYLGDCYLPRGAVKAILNSMVSKWMGPTYDMLRKNCCTFSNEFAIELGVGEIPRWTHRLANLAASLKDTLHVESKTLESAFSGEEHDADDAHVERYDLSTLLLEHVMAVRMQQAFRARKARERALERGGSPRTPARRRHSSDFDAF